MAAPHKKVERADAAKAFENICKSLSFRLRGLHVHDIAAIERFIEGKAHDEPLAARTMHSEMKK